MQKATNSRADRLNMRRMSLPPDAPRLQYSKKTPAVHARAPGRVEESGERLTTALARWAVCQGHAVQLSAAALTYVVKIRVQEVERLPLPEEETCDGGSGSGSSSGSGGGGGSSGSGGGGAGGGSGGGGAGGVGCVGGGGAAVVGPQA